MALNPSALNVGATAIGAAITHLGLVNGSGVEIVGGTYARKPVTWTNAVSGLVRPTANVLFDVPSGAVIAGWRGYTALTAGTDHGGELVVTETFTGAGTYTLLAGLTSIDLDAV